MTLHVIEVDVVGAAPGFRLPALHDAAEGHAN